MIPQLDGKLDGFSLRVPGARRHRITDLPLAAELKREATVEEINAASSRRPPPAP